MGPLDATGHVLNLLLPGLALGLLSAAAAKLVWRRELAPVPFKRLALPACCASATVVVGALWLFGRDGTMTMYGLMVTACAITLWWRGFGPGRKKP